MKRFFDLLVLTRREQRVVIAIVLLAIVVAAVVHYRMSYTQRPLPRLQTMDPTGEIKTRLSDEGAAEPPN
jgi:hypothetical protein